MTLRKGDASLLALATHCGLLDRPVREVAEMTVEQAMRARREAVEVQRALRISAARWGKA